MPKNIEAIYPLSAVQEGMLFHSMYAPEAGVYGCQFTCTLTGSLQPEAFREAMQKVLERHSILRTLIWERREKLFQVVANDVELPWEYLDWRGMSEPEQAARWEQYLDEERRRGFDLSRPPLMRTALIQMKDEAYRFIWSFHHMLLDGWSLSIVLKEMFTLYWSHCSGQEIHLDQPRPYKDYIAWLQRQDMSKVEDFWRKFLQGFLAPTPMHVDKPIGKRNKQTEEFTEIEWKLPRKTTTALQNLARQHGLTLNTLIQGGWAVLLSRYSGEEDVVFGAVVSGRSGDLAGIDSMVGLFINTLPMRVRLSAEDTLIPWLKKIQEQQVDLRQYEFSPLVDVHRWSEVSHGHPLFETVLVYENYPVDRTLGEWGGELSVQDVVSHTWTNYPLSIMVVPEAELRAKVLYDSSRFDGETIQRVMSHLETILTGMTENPAAKLSELPVLTEQERRQLMEWNATDAPYPTDICIQQLFETQAAQRPDAVALLLEDEQMTYRELDELSNQIARLLLREGVGPNVRVGVMMERSMEMIAAVLGILKAGGAYVPLDPSHPGERLAYVLENAEVAVLLAHSSCVENLPDEHPVVILWETEKESIRQESRERPGAETSAQNLAYIIYTSGSTGTPKGVMVRHQPVINLIEWVNNTFAMNESDRLLWVTSLGFDLSVYDIFGILGAGGSIRIVKDADVRDPKRLLQHLRSGEITFWDSAPAALQQVLPFLGETSGKAAESRLKRVFLSGDWIPLSMPDELKKHFPGVEVISLGGGTEATIWSNFYRIGEVEEDWVSIPYGKPIQNARYYVLDAHLNPCPIGVPGELYIGGACLAEGYANAPELTSQRFLPDPFGAPGDRMYRTGDMARYWPDGNMEFLGRVDNQVKIRGFRVELGEVEAAIAQHPNVQTALATIQEVPLGDKRLVAYVVPKSKEETLSSAWGAEQVSQWQTVFNEIYRQPSPTEELAYNTIGWTSSYTDLPIPQEEMKEWADRTVERILSQKPRRVLEIGCGSGMLLFQVAPHCEEYWATDLSEETIARLGQQIAAMNLPQVHLACREATNFAGIESGSFDMVVLNSVIQYFPSLSYLMDVLDGAIQALKPGGVIFLGDVRNYTLLRTFYTSLELFQAPDTLSAAQFQQRVTKRLNQEKELLIDPAFFAALRKRHSQISEVQVQLKKARHQNELSKFRYDVFLHVGKAHQAPAAPKEVQWEEETWNLAKVREVLSEEPEILVFRDIPNRRVREEQAAVDLLRSPSHPENVGELRKRLIPAREEGMDPEEFWQLGEDLSYDVFITWASSGSNDRMDVVFAREHAFSAPLSYEAILGGSGRDSRESKQWSYYANSPLQEKLFQQMLPQIRERVKEKLPEYMIPSAYLFLDGLPVTSNGKVDRRALPLPELTREGERQYLAPRDLVEMQLAQIWEELLGTRPIGVTDNFFELGGHSLLAVRLIMQIKEQFQQELPLSVLFEGTTIEYLARVLRQQEAGQERSSSPLVAIKPHGAKPPLFLVHPTGGNVLCYLHLARHIERDQPLYALQSPGLYDDWEHAQSIEAMAAHYIDAILSVRPDGPYLIGGWSYGATVAYEIALQMERRGLDVAKLLLIDSPAPNYTQRLPEMNQTAFLLSLFRELERFFGESVAFTEEEISGLSPDEQLPYLLEQMIRAGLIPPGSELADIDRLLEVYQTNLYTLQRYNPAGKFSGQAVLFHSTLPNEDDVLKQMVEEQDATAGWRHYLSRPVDMHAIPGDHVTMITEPNVRALAERIRSVTETGQKVSSI